MVYKTKILKLISWYYRNLCTVTPLSNVDSSCHTYWHLRVAKETCNNCYYIWNVEKKCNNCYWIIVIIFEM